MPKADPEQWKEARIQWETSEMTFSEVAAALHVAIPTVSLRARRELWVKSDVVQLDKVSYSPRQLTEIAMRALVRAALQTRDTASAVKAASLILDRTLGRVVAEQTVALLKPDLDAEESAAWPEWLKARRLAYQEGALPPDDGFEPSEAPDPALPLTQPPIDAPSIAAQAPSPIPEPFRPRLVQPEPRFWAGPGRPAS